LAVQATVQEGWRTILARIFSLDVADVHSDIGFFKIGEGGFVNVPPKQPIAPVGTRTDLESEGAPLAGGGTATFTNGTTAVVGVGTSFLADVAVGEWIKPGPTVSGFVSSAGVPGSEVDEWGEVQSVTDNLNIVLTAVYAGATLGGREVRKASEPLFTFRKTLTAGEVLFNSAVPAITEITAIVAAGEANADQLANPPEFFELGVFDANGVMICYVTFDQETKTGLVQLNHIVNLIF